MAGAAAVSCFSSSSSSSLLLLLLRQALLMSAASSDFKAAAYGAFFGAAAALLVSHLLLELTFSAVFSTLFALLFFCLSLLVLQRAFALRTAVPPPALLPPMEQEGTKAHQQQLQQHRFVAGSTAEAYTTAAAATTEAGCGVGAAKAAAAAPPLAGCEAESSRGDVEEIYLEEEREDSEAEALLQQQHVQQEYCRRQKERLQMRHMLFGLAAMLAVSALVAAVVDTRKFQTFHWLLKMPLYIFLSNSLCFLLVFAAVDVVNFYYDVAHPAGRTGSGCVETAAAAAPWAFAPATGLSSSNHYLYSAVSTSPSLPFPLHSPAAGYAPVTGFSSFAAPSVPLPPLASSPADGGGGSAAADALFFSSLPSPTLGISHTHFPHSAAGAATLSPADSSAQALAAAAAAAGALPVHNTLQVYILLAGSLLLGTTFGFFYGLFRFETGPHISIQLIRSRYVCLPLAVIIGSLAGVLVKRIGDLSTAAAVACALQQQQPQCGQLPLWNSSSLTTTTGIKTHAAAAAATADHSPFDTAAAAAPGAATDDAPRSVEQQQQQLFPVSAAASFLEAEEEEEEVEEENLLTFSAAEQRQLLLLA